MAKTPAVTPKSTGFWLMKSEPDAYSIDQLKKDGKTLWTGVRNYQARNFMMASMQKGDQVLFYHSNAEPSAIVGLAEIARTNLPDPTALDPKSDYYDAKSSPDHPIWFCAEVKYRAHVKKILPLSELKLIPELKTMLLLQKGSRLSITPVSAHDFKIVQRFAGLKGE